MVGSYKQAWGISRLDHRVAVGVSWNPADETCTVLRFCWETVVL